MKITRITWLNFKGLADGEITANGQDVIVSGQNGVGKSSIAQTVPFVLFGKVQGNVKRYEGGLTPTDDGLIHGAEIEFDSGTTLRREYFWTQQGNRQNLYINGQLVKLGQFKTCVDNLTGGGGELILNPFAFCNLPAREQRTWLLKIFGTLTDAQILSAPEFAEVAKIFDGLTSDTFIARTKLELNSTRQEAEAIPHRIDELNKRLKAAADDPDGFAGVETKIKTLHAERQKISANKPADFNVELNLQRKRLGDLERERERCGRHLEQSRLTVDGLRKKYLQVANSKAGVCPTCGQTMPLDKFKAQRDARLTNVTRDAKQLAADIAAFESRLKEIDTEQKNISAQIQILSERAQNQSADDTAGKIAAIDEQLHDLEYRRAQLKLAADTQTRIDELRERERELHKLITRLEGHLATAEKFQQQKVERVEGQINAHFEHVNFKLFDYLITSGEIRPTCEATLGGVPYVALSKGEKLKAALDIFRTLQKYFKTELPLFIDDAESYTANSFVELRNQLFLFRVSEEPQLSIVFPKAELTA